MRKTIRTQLNKLEVGSLICIRWGDPSASPVEDGSPEDLVKNHKGYNYFSWGVYMGVNKQHKTIILASDKVVDEDEYRGTNKILTTLITEVEVIKSAKDMEKYHRERN